MPKAMTAQEKQWEIEAAADTIMRRLEIKENKKLEAAAIKELKKRKKRIDKTIKKG